MQSVAARLSLLVSSALLGGLIIAPQAGAVATTGGVIAWGTTFAGVNVVPPQARSGVSAVAASSHALALKDGGVIAWGSDAEGQATVPAEAGSGVTAIAAGDTFSAAIAGGAVIVWGGSDAVRAVPAEAQSNIVAIAAGGGNIAALTSGGAVIAWGDDAAVAAVPAAATSSISAVGVGDGVAFAISQAVKPETVRNLRAKALKGGAQVSWQSPMAIQGAVLVGYQVKVNKGAWKDYGPAKTSIKLNGLGSKKSVTIKVRAVSYAGPGAAETVKVRTK